MSYYYLTPLKTSTGFTDVHSINLIGSSSQAINLGQSGVIFKSTNAYTYSLWFNTSSSAVMLLLTAGLTGTEPTGPGFLVMFGGGMGALASDSNGYSLTATGGGNIYADGNWHQATVTFNGGTGASAQLVLYVDGQLLASSTPNPNFTTLYIDDTQTDYIGQSQSGQYFTGYVDSFVVLEGTLLNSTQVMELYNGGVFKSPLTMSFHNYVTNWFPMGEGSDNSTTIYDTVGGLSGTLINSPTYSTNIP